MPGGMLQSPWMLLIHLALMSSPCLSLEQLLLTHPLRALMKMPTKPLDSAAAEIPPSPFPLLALLVTAWDLCNWLKLLTH